MKKLIIDAEGILYRNPRPGHKAECAFQPNVVVLSQKELLCFYRIGQAFYSLDGRLAQLRSSDGGLSWEQDGLVWDPVNDNAPFNYAAPHGTRLKDGTLLINAFRYDGSDPNRPFFDPETGGREPIENVLFKSVDNGRTWSKPEVMDLHGEGLADTPSQIIELNNGRLFIACETWKNRQDSSPLHIKGYGVFSDDGGATWKGRVEFPSASDNRRMYSHSRYSRMLDGRIIALQWTQEVGTAKDFNAYLVVSYQTAQEWSQSKPTNLPAQTSWVADLGNSLVAATYTRREGMKPGMLVVLSHDEGHTWDLDNQVMVWDAVGQEFLGVEHKPSYPASHDNIAFGKPNTARLLDGSIISSWWCTQACVTHSRYAKLHVE